MDKKRIHKLYPKSLLWKLTKNRSINYLGFFRLNMFIFGNVLFKLRYITVTDDTI